MAATGCGSDGGAAKPVTLTMVVYDSFPTKDSPLNTALDEFSTRTGIGVRLAVAGDAGTMATKARLTAGNPEGDVMWGVDNTLLSSVTDGRVFTPYRSPALADVPAALTALVPDGAATPVDYGDVCVNYDVGWFTSHDVPAPTSFEDLADPRYRGLLVVQNPGTSSPGLAFLLATIAHFGDGAASPGGSGGSGGWQTYWKALRANEVRVEDSWTTAYYTDFSGAAGSTGDRPMVVSYGSSPPAEVLGAASPPATAPTAVISSTCFRQVEFAGVLRGTKHEPEAQQLIDFLLGDSFQSQLALALYVYPARSDVALPDVFRKFAVVPADPLTIEPARIEANRAKWQDEWTQLVLR